MPDQAEQPQTPRDIATTGLDIIRPDGLGDITRTIEDIKDRKTDLAAVVMKDTLITGGIPIADGLSRQHALRAGLLPVIEAGYRKSPGQLIGTIQCIVLYPGPAVLSGIERISIGVVIQCSVDIKEYFFSGMIIQSDQTADR